MFIKKNKIMKYFWDWRYSSKENISQTPIAKV